MLRQQKTVFNLPMGYMYVVLLISFVLLSKTNLKSLLLLPYIYIFGRFSLVFKIKLLCHQTGEGLLFITLVLESFELSAPNWFLQVKIWHPKRMRGLTWLGKDTISVLENWCFKQSADLYCLHPWESVTMTTDINSMVVETSIRSWHTKTSGSLAHINKSVLIVMYYFDSRNLF